MVSVKENTPKASGMTNEQGSLTGLGSLQALIERAGGPNKQMPPVEKWHPENCGKLDIVIKRDGSWFYMGTPIGRDRLVKLFSTVLRKDEDRKTYLVTPVEKIEIKVEDAHFIAVEMNVLDKGQDQVLTFRTNVGDVIEAGIDTPLRFEIAAGNFGVKPYLRVRGRLEALISRAVMYELIESGEEVEVDGKLMFGVKSGGQTFPIMDAQALAKLSGDE